MYIKKIKKGNISLEVKVVILGVFWILALEELNNNYYFCYVL